MLNLKARDISPAASTKKGILNCFNKTASTAGLIKSQRKSAPLRARKGSGLAELEPNTLPSLITTLASISNSDNKSSTFFHKNVSNIPF